MDKKQADERAFAEMEKLNDEKAYKDEFNRTFITEKQN